MIDPVSLLLLMFIAVIVLGVYFIIRIIRDVNQILDQRMKEKKKDKWQD